MTRGLPSMASDAKLDVSTGRVNTHQPSVLFSHESLSAFLKVLADMENFGNFILTGCSFLESRGFVVCPFLVVCFHEAKVNDSDDHSQDNA